MALKAIEFVDYIFDRYAFLGVPEDASLDDIKKAISKRKAGNHPDNLPERTDPSVVALTRRNWELTEQCEAVLANPELRTLYDQKLADFKENCPHGISRDGRQIITMRRGQVRLDIDFLLGDTQKETTAQILDHARIITKYDPQKLDRARQQAKRKPKDTALASMYRSALEEKIIYLNAVRDALWHSIGVYGVDSDTKNNLQRASQFTKQVDAQIAQIREEAIPAQTQSHGQMLALGYDKQPLLLLTHVKAETTGHQQVATVETTQMLAKVQSRFAELSQAIKDNADDSSATMQEFLNATPTLLLHKKGSEAVDIVVMRDDASTGAGSDFDTCKVISAMRIKLPEGESNITEMEEVHPDWDNLSIKELKRKKFKTTTIAIINYPNFEQVFLTLNHAYALAMAEFGIYDLATDAPPEVKAKRPAAKPTKKKKRTPGGAGSA